MLMQPLSPRDDISFHTMAAYDQDNSMFHETEITFSPHVELKARCGRGLKRQTQKKKVREMSHDIKPASKGKSLKKPYAKSSMKSSQVGARTSAQSSRSRNQQSSKSSRSSQSKGIKKQAKEVNAPFPQPPKKNQLKKSQFMRNCHEDDADEQDSEATWTEPLSKQSCRQDMNIMNPQQRE